MEESTALLRTLAGMRPARCAAWTWRPWVAVVCQELGVSPQDLCRRARGSLARPLVAHLLCKYAGLTQRQVAETLGLGTGAAVSIQLKNLREALARDRRLKETLARVDHRLQSLAEAAKAKGRRGS